MRFGVRVLVQLSADVLLEDAGKHESGYRTWNIDGSNIVAPTASLASSDVKSDSFTLNATGSDSDSGVVKYEFYINDVKKHEVETSDGKVNWVVNADSYGSEITAETTYTCKVRVYDAAGNWKDSEEISVTTMAEPVVPSAIAKVGEYVDYEVTIGTTKYDKWRILHFDTNGHMEIVCYNGPSYTLGTDSGGYTTDSTLYAESRDDYANCIQILNNESQAYINSAKYAVGARHLGSNPTSPNDYATINSSYVVFNADYATQGSSHANYPYLVQTHYQKAKTTDPDKDVDALKKFAVSPYLNSASWLAARDFYVGSRNSRFSVRYVKASGSVSYNGLFYSHSDGTFSADSYSSALAPVVSLDSEVLLVPGSGDGTSGSPWKMTYVDTTEPTATLASSNVKETSFTLTATGSDNIGVTKYEFYINGTKEHTIETTEGSVSWDVTGKTTGETYTCKVRVYDAAGNWADSEEISVTPTDAVKLASVVEVGDFVDYDAGIWTQEDLDKITASTGSPTVNNSSDLPDTQGEFGGFTTGQSRNTNSTSFLSSATPDYSGWRVWEVDGDTVTLISAGHPETYYCGSDSTTSQSILQNRNCTMYVNSYATSAHFITKAELDTWYNVHIDSSITDTYDIAFPTADSVPIITLVENGSFWWLASDCYSSSLYDVEPVEPNVSNSSARGCGVRVLVTLKSDILAKPDIGDGSQHNPYQILGDGTAPTKTSWDGPIATGFASGSGSETDPYMVESIEQLAYLAKTVNEGNSYKGQYIQLGAEELNFMDYYEDYSWVPIGNEYNPFSGNFSPITGWGGVNIKFLDINNESSNYQGLFGVIDGGRVEGINLEELCVSGNNNVGGICGAAYNNAQIINCSIRTSSFYGTEKVGSIVGSLYNSSSVSYCYVDDVNSAAQNYVGGIVGYLQTNSSISNSNMNIWIGSSFSNCAGLCSGYGGTGTSISSVAIAGSQFSTSSEEGIELIVCGYEDGVTINGVTINGAEITS